MSLLFIRKHFDLCKGFEKHRCRVLCIIHICQHTDSWEKCFWGVGRLWAQCLSLTNPRCKTPSATTHKHFHIRRVGRITSSGVIYFISEFFLSLVFFIVSVFVVSSILSVLLAATHLPNTEACIAKKSVCASGSTEYVCLLAVARVRSKPPTDLWFMFVFWASTHEFFVYK